MKKIRLGALALALCGLTGAATAELTVSELVVRMSVHHASIHVAVNNSGGSVPPAGPMKLTLYARPNGYADWKEVKSWDNLAALPAGESLVRDVNSDDSEALKEVVGHPTWQGKAVVDLPKAVTIQRAVVFSYNPDSDLPPALP